MSNKEVPVRRKSIARTFTSALKGLSFSKKESSITDLPQTSSIGSADSSTDQTAYEKRVPVEKENEAPSQQITVAKSESSVNSNQSTNNSPEKEIIVEVRPRYSRTMTDLPRKRSTTKSKDKIVEMFENGSNFVKKVLTLKGNSKHNSEHIDSEQSEILEYILDDTMKKLEEHSKAESDASSAKKSQEDKLMNIIKLLKLRIKELEINEKDLKTPELVEQHQKATQLKEKIQKAVELLKSSVKASSKNGSDFMKALLDRAEEAEKKEKGANEKVECLELQVKNLQELLNSKIQVVTGYEEYPSSPKVKHDIRKSAEDLQNQKELNELTTKYNQQLVVDKNRLEAQISKLREEKLSLENSISELTKQKSNEEQKLLTKHELHNTLIRLKTEQKKLSKQSDMMANEADQWRIKYESERLKVSNLESENSELERELQRIRQSRTSATRRDSESELEDKYLHLIDQIKQEAEKQISALKLENELLRQDSKPNSPMSSRRSSNADSINGDPESDKREDRRRKKELRERQMKEEEEKWEKEQEEKRKERELRRKLREERRKAEEEEESKKKRTYNTWSHT